MSEPTSGDAVATDDLQTLDIEFLGELGLLDDGMGGLLAELVDEFVDVTEGHLRELRGSVADGDATGVCRLAHTVRGSGAQLGGLVLAAACTRLEQQCDAGPPDRGADALNEVEVAYQALARALQALVAPAT